MPTRPILGPALALALLASFPGPGPARPVRAGPSATIPLDRFFRGRVAALEKGVLTLMYDFGAPEQVEDWTERRPFPVDRRDGQGIGPVEGALEVRGNAAARHVAVWKGDVVVRARLVPDVARDLGVVLLPADDEGQDFVAFTMGETFFHRWEGQPGGANAILKAGPSFRRPGGPPDAIGFRWIVRRPPPPAVLPGRSVEIACGSRRGRFFLECSEVEISGKDQGKRLGSCRPALYVLEGTMKVEEVTIEGRLDDSWLAEKGIALRTERPIEPGGPPPR